MNDLYITDFNKAKPQGQFDLIPTGTIAKVRIGLREGNYGENNLFYESASGAIGLKLDFVILEGPYKDKMIIQLIGIRGTKKDEQGNDKWRDTGQSLIRGILESARNIDPKDELSEKAIQARNVKDYKELYGLKCLIKIGVEIDKTGQYSDKNKVTAAITPDHKDYSLLMNNSDNLKGYISTTPPNNVKTDDDFTNHEIPF